MRQYMALMQQAMGMPGMNGSSSRHRNPSLANSCRDSGLSMASGSDGEFGGFNGAAGTSPGKTIIHSIPEILPRSG